MTATNAVPDRMPADEPLPAPWNHVGDWTLRCPADGRQLIAHVSARTIDDNPVGLEFNVRATQGSHWFKRRSTDIADLRASLVNWFAATAHLALRRRYYLVRVWHASDQGRAWSEQPAGDAAPFFDATFAAQQLALDRDKWFDCSLEFSVRVVWVCAAPSADPIFLDTSAALDWSRPPAYLTAWNSTAFPWADREALRQLALVSRGGYHHFLSLDEAAGRALRELRQRVHRARVDLLEHIGSTLATLAAPADPQ